LETSTQDQQCVYMEGSSTVPSYCAMQRPLADWERVSKPHKETGKINYFTLSLERGIASHCRGKLMWKKTSHPTQCDVEEQGATQAMFKL